MRRVVVLGGGFAGVETVRCLDKGGRGRLDVTLVSDKNYLLFTPLLPQVGSSLIEPRHIIQPTRDLRGHRTFRFRRDRVGAIDFPARTVVCAEGTVGYDRLVIALGGVILRGVHPSLAQRARRRLDGAGIEVRTLTRVTRVHADAVEVTDGTRLDVGLTVWATGAGYAASLFWNALHLFKLVGFRKQLQVALDWWLAGVFPRDSAIMRPPVRCPICARAAARAREAA